MISKSFEEVLSAHHRLSVIKEFDDDKSLASWNTRFHLNFGLLSKQVDRYSHKESKITPTSAKFMMVKIPLHKSDGETILGLLKISKT